MHLNLSKFFLQENLNFKIIVTLKIKFIKTQLMKMMKMLQIILKVFYFNQVMNILRKKKIQR